MSLKPTYPLSIICNWVLSEFVFAIKQNLLTESLIEYFSGLGL